MIAGVTILAVFDRAKPGIELPLFFALALFTATVAVVASLAQRKRIVAGLLLACVVALVSVSVEHRYVVNDGRTGRVYRLTMWHYMLYVDF